MERKDYILFPLILLIKVHGTLKKSFREKGLWSDEIEQKIDVVETKINSILQGYDTMGKYIK